MSTEVTPESTTARRWGARSIASLLIFIVATVLLVPALVGHWGHRTVIDSERYIQTVGPLIEQPAVQQALAETVTEAVVAKVDTESQVQTLLGSLFDNTALTDAIAAPVAAGINSLIGELVTKFVASDQFATVWIELNKAAQKGVILVLEGREGGVVSLQGDELVLDTSAALTAIQSYLVESGIDAAANITIPESDRQIVLAETPALAQIRTIYGLTSPILQWLPIIVAIMFGAAVLLARRRARTVVATGIVLLVSGVVVLIAIGAGESQFTNALSGTPWGAAATVFWSTLLEYLIAGTQAIVTLGVVVIIAGWFGGRTGLARLARGHVTRGLGELSSRAYNGGAGPLSSSAATYVRWGIYIVGALILLISDLMSVSTVLWVSALVAGAITVVQLVSAEGAADGPATEPSTSSTPEVGETSNV